MLSDIHKIASEFSNPITHPEERGLTDSFEEVCLFLKDHPDFLSWRGGNKPDVTSLDVGSVRVMANKYFLGYRKSDFPAEPSTIPDPMVSHVLNVAYGYSESSLSRIRVEHQHSMCAENCVGSLLERYIDSKMRDHGWAWCCGEMVRAIDFVKYDENNKSWYALQIKNRDNSENSSSSRVRHGTKIEKWFRSFSRRAETNWGGLPSLMQGYGLSEDGFKEFVKLYLESQKN